MLAGHRRRRWVHRSPHGRKHGKCLAHLAQQLGLLHAGQLPPATTAVTKHGTAGCCSTQALKKADNIPRVMQACCPATCIRHLGADSGPRDTPLMSLGCSGCADAGGCVRPPRAAGPTAVHLGPAAGGTAAGCLPAAGRSGPGRGSGRAVRCLEQNALALWRHFARGVLDSHAASRPMCVRPQRAHR